MLDQIIAWGRASKSLHQLAQTEAFFAHVLST